MKSNAIASTVMAMAAAAIVSGVAFVNVDIQTTVLKHERERLDEYSAALDYRAQAMDGLTAAQGNLSEALEHKEAALNGLDMALHDRYGRCGWSDK